MYNTQQIQKPSEEPIGKKKTISLTIFFRNRIKKKKPKKKKKKNL